MRTSCNISNSTNINYKEKLLPLIAPVSVPAPIPHPPSSPDSAAPAPTPHAAPAPTLEHTPAPTSTPGEEPKQEQPHEETPGHGQLGILSTDMLAVVLQV